MSVELVSYYQETIKSAIATTKDINRFLMRLKMSKFTRVENPTSHCCAMILAFDPKEKKVLVIHHKKANSWFFPGGHIDPYELPTQTAIREAKEELGLTLAKTDLIGPFGIQVLDINNPPQICREHYDVFFGVITSPTAVNVNMEEFHRFDWLTIDEARQRISLPYYLDALDKFIKFLKW